MKWKAWNAALSDMRQKLAVKRAKCGYCGRVHSRSPWSRLRRRRQGVRMQGSWYCRTQCLERSLAEVLGREHPVSREMVAAHRVPLGLLLLSRQQVTGEQLRTALELQRKAGHGKIGEWLRQLGFATEPQITAALARQWSCPVLRSRLEDLGASRFHLIPLLLLESFQMIPVEFAAAPGTLLIAFGEGVDHTMLYAIEQMLGCRTEACLVCPSALQKGLHALAQRRGAGDVIFDRMEDAGECARIIGSYATKVGAEQVRMARCGKHIWIRLESLSREAVNLVLRAPEPALSDMGLDPADAVASAF